MGLRRKTKVKQDDEGHQRQVDELSNLIDYLNEVVRTIEVRMAAAPGPDSTGATIPNRHI